ncbi:TPA: phosphatidate cytidylyltransferase [Candidatus Poribacteria bacterium]|nr:phosphatidate cytidylyltransferase [Candidatus Poribacteria bacterium]HEX28690.1 phosphatidate cytidylyltransferase [Candidatus Poribacteria bacterium]
MLRRILSAFLFVPIILALSLHPISFTALSCVITVMIYLEFVRMGRNLGVWFPEPIGVLTVGIMPILAYLSLNPMPFLVGAILLVSLFNVVHRKGEGALLSLSSAVFGLIYIGWMYGFHLVELRMMDEGLKLILLLLAVIWLGDTGAYFTGKAIGRHKLIPAVSPGKTIEGSIGGLIWGIGGAIAVKYIFTLDLLSLPHLISLSLVMGITGQIGDLTESIIKRNAGMKDSGNLIPGHGGMFDRCDSMIPAVPVMIIYLRMFQA